MDNTWSSCRQKSILTNIQISSDWILLISFVLICLCEHPVEPNSHTTRALSTIITGDVSYLIRIINNSTNGIGSSCTSQIIVERGASQKGNYTIDWIQHNIDIGIKTARNDIWFSQFRFDIDWC